jgi:hypothetical protein
MAARRARAPSLSAINNPAGRFDRVVRIAQRELAEEQPGRLSRAAGSRPRAVAAAVALGLREAGPLRQLRESW